MRSICSATVPYAFFIVKISIFSILPLPLEQHHVKTFCLLPPQSVFIVNFQSLERANFHVIVDYTIWRYWYSFHDINVIKKLYTVKSIWQNSLFVCYLTFDSYLKFLTQLSIFASIFFVDSSLYEIFERRARSKILERACVRSIGARVIWKLMPRFIREIFGIFIYEKSSPLAGQFREVDSLLRGEPTWPCRAWRVHSIFYRVMSRQISIEPIHVQGTGSSPYETVVTSSYPRWNVAAFTPVVTGLAHRPRQKTCETLWKLILSHRRSTSSTGISPDLLGRRRHPPERKIDSRPSNGKGHCRSYGKHR